MLDADVALVPHAIGFRYADPRLEALTPAQKQFLRLGPRNVQKVSGKLREVRAALARRRRHELAAPARALDAELARRIVRRIRS